MPHADLAPTLTDSKTLQEVVDCLSEHIPIATQGNCDPKTIFEILVRALRVRQSPTEGNPPSGLDSPTRELVVVTDSRQRPRWNSAAAVSKRSLSIHMISRLRLDAALYEPAPLLSIRFDGATSTERLKIAQPWTSII